MAQDNWLNVTVDTGTSAQDRKKHGCVGGTAAAGDATFSYDHLKVPDLNTYDSIAAAFRLRLIAGGLK